MPKNTSGPSAQRLVGKPVPRPAPGCRDRVSALERGQVATVLAALETLAQEREQTTPVVAELARKTIAYFARRVEQVDYPGFVAAGKQIGSGLAESACKRFGTD